MRHYFRTAVFALALIWTGQALGQSNPKKGYIITNSQDTIYGTVDYRSNTKNAKSCLFQANGETTFKEYSPKDISGYRFDEDGIFYVSRTFPVDGVQKEFFAEFLLKGGVCLYYYPEGDNDYYFFVKEDGEVVQTKKSRASNIDEQTAIHEKQAIVAAVSKVFTKSPKAVYDIQKGTYRKDNLIRVTRAYDEEFCSEYGDCVQFEQDIKKALPVKFRFLVEAGVAAGKVKAEYAHFDNPDFSGAVPMVGAGIEMSFPRHIPNLALQAKLVYMNWSMKNTEPAINDKESENKISGSEFGIMVGLKYQFFPNSPVVPFLAVGGHAMTIGKFEVEQRGPHLGNGVQSDSWGVNGIGVYFGGGIDIKAGKHAVRLAVNHVPGRGHMNKTETSYTSFTAGFLF